MIKRKERRYRRQILFLTPRQQAECRFQRVWIAIMTALALKELDRKE